MATRVDLGRVFPGLLIFLIGLGLFALWIVLVFVSFFAFFVPPLQGVFTFALGILAASVVLMVAGGLVIFTGVSGWGRLGATSSRPEPREEGWFGRVSAKRAFKDRLSGGERFGEIIGVVVSFAVGFYFVESQRRGTGFFTPAFGPAEEVLFYGPWVVGMVVGLVRAFYGRRNAIRPLEVAQSLFLVVAVFSLLSVFPFDFSHIPDLLPQATRFLFGWVNDQVGAIAMVLAAIGGLASLAYTSVLYVAVRSQLRHGFASAA